MKRSKLQSQVLQYFEIARSEWASQNDVKTTLTKRQPSAAETKSEGSRQHSNSENLDEKKAELLTEDRNHEDAECYINQLMGRTMLQLQA